MCARRRLRGFISQAAQEAVLGRGLASLRVNLAQLVIEERRRFPSLRRACNLLLNEVGRVMCAPEVAKLSVRGLPVAEPASESRCLHQSAVLDIVTTSARISGAIGLVKREWRAGPVAAKSSQASHMPRTALRLSSFCPAAAALCLTQIEHSPKWKRRTLRRDSVADAGGRSWRRWWFNEDICPMHSFWRKPGRTHARCRAMVAERPHRSATPAQLANGVPMFLEQLTRTLRAEEEGDAPEGARHIRPVRR